MSITTPEWVKHAVFYQIFPDRFARSGTLDLPAGLRLKPWGTAPEAQGFQGGDLPGITARLDYLSDLGITALYLNPIFASAANHRYHTFDYYRVDPLLGGNAALRELLDAAHSRGIRIVLDGVFNHASRGFWPFHHILENGGDSPYLDWFIIRGWPLRPYNSSRRYPPNYDCWWNLPALPKLNFDTPAVREYFLDVARYWIEFGIDGWRLDVPEEIEHEGFWQAFRRTVKGANPDAYIVGEIWHLAPEWLKGDRFDALMNYPMGEAAVSFFGGDALRTDYRQGEYNPEHIDGTELGRRLDTILTQYPWAATQVQLNCFDSHDTARLRWILGDDDAAMHMCVLFQMTMPGAPCVYYGDEIGLNGGHEPLSREAFPWDRESDWNRELLAAYREAIALRHAHSVLRTGDYLLLHGDGDLFAFARTLDDRVAIVAFNRGEKPTSLSIGVGDICRDGQRLTGIFGGAPDMTVKGHHVMLHAIPPRTGQVWVAEN